MKKILKILGVLFSLVLTIIIIIGSILTYQGYQLYQNTIEEKPMIDMIQKIRQQEDYLTLDEITKDFKEAVIAVEDHRFYDHGGIDLITTMQAMFRNMKTLSFAEGGSTITQQLAKNVYFTQEKKVTRKIAELFMAFQLEKKYTKEEILELYINTSYFGRGCYGLNDAAYVFYQKEANELTTYEATYLAGIPNAPSIYSVDNTLGQQRHWQVLSAMVKYDYLTLEEAQNIYNQKND